MAALSYGNVMAVLDLASVRTLPTKTLGINITAKTVTTANTASVFNQNIVPFVTSVSSNVFVDYAVVNQSQFSTVRNTSNLGKIRTFYITGANIQFSNSSVFGAINFGNTPVIDSFGNMYQSLGQSYTTTGVYVVGKGGLAAITTGEGGGGGGLTGKIESWT